ncbi:hypothetical protein D3C85_1613950 [compost metagenome]
MFDVHQQALQCSIIAPAIKLQVVANAIYHHLAATQHIQLLEYRRQQFSGSSQFCLVLGNQGDTRTRGNNLFAAVGREHGIEKLGI